MKYTLYLSILAFSSFNHSLTMSMPTDPDTFKAGYVCLGAKLNQAQIQALAQEKDRLKTELDLDEMHPVLAIETQKAIKYSGLTQPIILLQDNNPGTSAVYNLDQSLKPKALVLNTWSTQDTNKPLGLIKADLYHELGHIVNQDSTESQSSHNLKRKAILGLSLGVGILAAKHSPKLMQNPSKIIKLGTGITASLSTAFLSALSVKAAKANHSRIQEAKADLFAINSLIKQNDLEPLVLNFINYTFNIDKGRSNYKNEPDFLHDHPSYKQRAHSILVNLKKAGVDFNDLNVASSDYDQAYLQTTFTVQMHKHFPEFLA